MTWDATPTYITIALGLDILILRYMITRDKIEEIIDNCMDKGYDVSERDISYLILKREFQDGALAYSMVYNDSYISDYRDYESRDEIVYLREYMNTNYVGKKQKKAKSDYKDISFDENKDAIIELLEDIKEKYDNGELEYKDYAKMSADLRIKLNDKFNVSEEVNEQQIIVTKKFDYICPYLKKECWVQTKEDAMERFGLVEATKNKRR